MDTLTIIKATIGVVGLLALVYWLPRWQVKRTKGVENDKVWEATNEYRKTILQVIGGLIVIAGLFITYFQFKDSRKQYEDSQKQFQLSQENIKTGQISSRYGQAIEMLSKKDTTTRIGAIYALEQIAKESPNYLQTNVDVLCSFVRNFKYTDKDGKEIKDKDVEQVASEVQAAVTVIGRIWFEVANKRRPELPDERFELWINWDVHEKELAKLREKFPRPKIDLSGAKLMKAHLVGAHLGSANLSKSNLMWANLRGANLRRAKLTGAFLEYANLTAANLAKAYLGDADLSGAIEFLRVNREQLLKAESLHQTQGIPQDTRNWLEGKRREIFLHPSSKEYKKIVMERWELGRKKRGLKNFPR